MGPHAWLADTPAPALVDVPDETTAPNRRGGAIHLPRRPRRSVTTLVYSATRAVAFVACDNEWHRREPAPTESLQDKTILRGPNKDVPGW